MSKERKQSFMGGVTVLAISTILVKICGALYKIPLGNILGEEGVTHFMSAYNIYSVLLTLSTAGLPLALSKLVSEANSLGRTNQVRRCFRAAMALFAGMGVLGSAAMLLFTEELAAWMNNSLAYWPIKVLGVSVICVSVMCAFRGYAQGRQNMVPTAVSQLIESVVKLFIGLPVAWYLIRLGFGVEIGAAGAIVGVTVSELVYAEYITDIEFGCIIELKFFKKTFNGNICFCKVSLFRFVCLLFLFVRKTNLYGCVTVNFNGFFLDNRTRTSLYNRNRYKIAVLSEDLGHTNFLTQDCLFHFYPPNLHKHRFL